MRFADANVFIYAVLKPTKVLTEKEKRIKEKAKRIFRDISQGEEVLTTVVHLSEIANFLEDAANQTFALEFVRDLLTKSNITVESIDDKQYLAAAVLAMEKKISANDALAYIVMTEKNVREIYSFDKHFDALEVVRVHE